MRRTPTSRFPWIVAVIVSTALAVTVTAGCGGDNKPPTKTDIAMMNTIATTIRSELAARPDVTSAQVVNQDNIDASGATVVDVRPQPT
jgi:hypothetical protein